MKRKQDEHKTHYSVTELADLAGVTGARIRQLLADGKELRGVKIGPNWAITVAEAERWLADRQRQA